MEVKRASWLRAGSAPPQAHARAVAEKFDARVFQRSVGCARAVAVWARGLPEPTRNWQAFRKAGGLGPVCRMFGSGSASALRVNNIRCQYLYFPYERL
jgi:hypothetical protein